MLDGQSANWNLVSLPDKATILETSIALKGFLVQTLLTEKPSPNGFLGCLAHLAGVLELTSRRAKEDGVTLLDLHHEPLTAACPFFLFIPHGPPPYHHYLCNGLTAACKLSS